MCDTPSHGSDHLWVIWKESIQTCRCYREDTAGGTDGRTDGQTDGRTEWNQYTPQQLRCSGGIIRDISSTDLGKQLDISTTCRRLTPPWSLPGTSTHPTKVTQRSCSWSWMIHSHSFHSMSIGCPIPVIRLFKTLTLKLQGQGNRCGQRVVIQSAQCLIDLLPFCFPPIRPTMQWTVHVIQDMYSNAQSHMWVNGQYSEEFGVNGVGVGVHQGSVLSPLLFILVLEVLPCEFRTGVPWELVYADHLVLIASTQEECISKLKAC